MGFFFTRLSGDYLMHRTWTPLWLLDSYNNERHIQWKKGQRAPVSPSFIRERK